MQCRDSPEPGPTHATPQGYLTASATSLAAAADAADAAPTAAALRADTFSPASGGFGGSPQLVESGANLIFTILYYYTTIKCYYTRARARARARLRGWTLRRRFRRDTRRLRRLSSAGRKWRQPY